QQRNLWLAAALCAAALAASLLIVSFGSSLGSSGASRAGPLAEFRAKSLSAADSPERWAGIQIYRLRGSGTPEPLGAQLSTADGLLFAYTNLGPTPFEYLMLFARGAAGRVYWFYPAYEREGSDPASTPLQAGQAHRLLAEVIRHGYEPGPLS